MRGEYIKQIEIECLWKGRKPICWRLNRDVNILSGVNGMGKSTIINRVVDKLEKMQKPYLTDTDDNVKVTIAPEGATEICFDVVRSFDNTMIPASIASKLTDGLIRSELDWRLYELQRRYLDYQVNIGNRIIAVLQSGDADAAEKAQKISEPKKKFQDMIDSLFAETGKRLVRTQNDIAFSQIGEQLTPYQLSSGEKQMLVILLTVLIEDHQP